MLQRRIVTAGYWEGLSEPFTQHNLSDLARQARALIPGATRVPWECNGESPGRTNRGASVGPTGMAASPVTFTRASGPTPEQTLKDVADELLARHTHCPEGEDSDDE